MFKIASCSPYWLQIKFSISLFFYLFTFAINLWHEKFVTVDVTAVFVNNQHGIQHKDNILIKTHKYTHNTVIRIEKLKSVYLKCNLFAFSSISAEYLQTFEFLISRGSYKELKGGNFFETQCISARRSHVCCFWGMTLAPFTAVTFGEGSCTKDGRYRGVKHKARH